VALAFGGVGPVTVMAPAAAAALTGRPWTEATLREAVAALAQDIAIAPDAPGAPPVCPLPSAAPARRLVGPDAGPALRSGGCQAGEAGLCFCICVVCCRVPSIMQHSYSTVFLLQQGLQLKD